MFAFISAVVSWLACRFRGRAELELQIFALQHQLAVLRRQHPGRIHLYRVDRAVWLWLYRVWPRCLNTIVLVKPATVVQWHRQGRDRAAQLFKRKSSVFAPDAQLHPRIPWVAPSARGVWSLRVPLAGPNRADSDRVLRAAVDG